MATAHGKDATVSWDNASDVLTDITTYVQSVSGPPGSAAADEDTTMGSDDKTFVAGLKESTVSLTVVYDATIAAIFNAARGAAKSWSISYDGGVTTYSGEAIVTDFTPNAPVGGIVTAAVSAQVTGVITVS